MSKWQKIETAPKDGSEILGWREDCDCMIVRYTALTEFLTDREMENSDYDEDTLHDLCWFYADFVYGGRLEGDLIPTHWMPLPSPPEDMT